MLMPKNIVRTPLTEFFGSEHVLTGDKRQI